MKKACAIFAKLIRTVCIPPVMVAALILLLYGRQTAVFKTPTEAVVAFCLLALLPSLAYPCSYMIASVRERGREGQRSLAMYFSVFGYVLAFFYGLLADCRAELRMLFCTYLLSVLLLLCVNKLLHIRASGHACSVTGPIVFCCYFLGLGGILGGIAMYALVLWSSLYLKRHTPTDFVLGTVTCLVSFFLSWLSFLAFV
ncbi:MAG: hypothetical protein IJY20_01190 [Clostridia bacterium]|nr:hypothetical protein [Clostridia bacterium]